MIACVAQTANAVASTPLYSRNSSVAGSQRMPSPRSTPTARIASGISAASSCHGCRSSGDCVQRWRRMWIVTAAHRTALSSSPSAPASSPGLLQSIEDGFSSRTRPASPRTSPISSGPLGRIRKPITRSTATHSGIVYTSTDERPASTTWRARFWSTTPAATWTTPIDRMIERFPRSGRRSRPRAPRNAVISTSAIATREAA